jgi:hypothetical protein
MLTLADLHRAATQAGETRLAAAIAPALPRLPADLLRECAQAAGIATTHNQDTDA